MKHRVENMTKITLHNIPSVNIVTNNVKKPPPCWHV